MRFFQKIILLFACLSISCSSIPSPDLLNSDNTTTYTTYGGFTGGSFIFYRDSTYHYNYWSDDMSSCIDSGKFSFSDNLVTFKSIYQTDKKYRSYDNDTCGQNNVRYTLDNNRLYHHKKDGTIDKKGFYVKEDVLKREKEERRNSNSKNQKKIRSTIKKPDDSTSTK